MNNNISRRGFIRKASVATLAGITCGGHSLAKNENQPSAKKVQHVFPRWRGFNVLYFFSKWHKSNPAEMDFKITRDWGLDFIRVPMSYWIYSSKDDPYIMKPEILEQVDTIID